MDEKIPQKPIEHERAILEPAIQRGCTAGPPKIIETVTVETHAVEHKRNITLPFHEDLIDKQMTVEERQVTE